MLSQLYQVCFVYSSASLPLVFFKTKNYFPSKAEKPVYAGACSPTLKTNTVLAWIIGDCFLVHLKVSHNQKASSSFFLCYYVQIVFMYFSTVQSQQVYFLNRDGISFSIDNRPSKVIFGTYIHCVSHGWYFTPTKQKKKKHLHIFRISSICEVWSLNLTIIFSSDHIPVIPNHVPPRGDSNGMYICAAVN